MKDPMDVFFRKLKETNSVKDSITTTKEYLLKRKLELYNIESTYEEAKSEYTNILRLYKIRNLLRDLLDKKSSK